MLLQVSPPFPSCQLMLGQGSNPGLSIIQFLLGAIPLLRKGRGVDRWSDLVPLGNKTMSFDVIVTHWEVLKEKRNSLIIYDFSLETYKHEGIYRVRTVTDNNIKSKAAQNTRNNTIDQSPVLWSDLGRDFLHMFLLLDPKNIRKTIHKILQRES